ncbi:MAG: efflux RND transporter periplasmic adaptor subunit [Bacteroidales bacterium]|nr:efflux RND transporter periplasmic adaptor subunit [Bacteroidales bacterium]
MAKKRNKKKRTTTWIIIAVAVVLVFLIIGKKANIFGKDIAHKVSTDLVTYRDITEIVTANGKIQPETEIKISPDVSGEIVELVIKEGDAVKKGDYLLKIKPDLYESAVSRAEASLNSAKANLANSKARQEQVQAQFKQTELSFKRNKSLYEQGAISQSEFENAQAAYDMGKADVNAALQSVKAAEFAVLSAEATVKEAGENLYKTSVYAPMDGIVSMLNVEAGERVVGTELMAGTEMLRIANMDLMEVTVDVNENDIVKIRLNDTADIEVDAYLNRKFTGIVTEIANSATVSGLSVDQVTNFKVKIRILQSSYSDLIESNNPFPFRPGMSASVDIRTNTVYNTLTVPLPAVTTRVDTAFSNNYTAETSEDEDTEQELMEVVFVFEDGMAKMRRVKTGIQDAFFIQVIEGLEENEEVISAPYNLISKTLQDETKVSKVEKQELFKVSN